MLCSYWGGGKRLQIIKKSKSKYVTRFLYEDLSLINSILLILEEVTVYWLQMYDSDSSWNSYPTSVIIIIINN